MQDSDAGKRSGTQVMEQRFRLETGAPGWFILANHSQSICKSFAKVSQRLCKTFATTRF